MEWMILGVLHRSDLALVHKKISSSGQALSLDRGVNVFHILGMSSIEVTLERQKLVGIWIYQQYTGVVTFLMSTGISDCVGACMIIISCSARSGESVWDIACNNYCLPIVMWLNISMGGRFSTPGNDSNMLYFIHCIRGTTAVSNFHAAVLVGNWV